MIPVQERVTELVAELAVVADLRHQAEEIGIVGIGSSKSRARGRAMRNQDLKKWGDRRPGIW
jgi:hypothetical protein